MWARIAAVVVGIVPGRDDGLHRCAVRPTVESFARVALPPNRGPVELA
jgi:hypothetical protein